MVKLWGEQEPVLVELWLERLRDEGALLLEETLNKKRQEFFLLGDLLNELGNEPWLRWEEIGAAGWLSQALIDWENFMRFGFEDSEQKPLGAHLVYLAVVDEIRRRYGLKILKRIKSRAVTVASSVLAQNEMPKYRAPLVSRELLNLILARPEILSLVEVGETLYQEIERAYLDVGRLAKEASQVVDYSQRQRNFIDQTYDQLKWLVTMPQVEATTYTQWIAGKRTAIISEKLISDGKRARVEVVARLPQLLLAISNLAEADRLAETVALGTHPAVIERLEKEELIHKWKAVFGTLVVGLLPYCIEAAELGNDLEIISRVNDCLGEKLADLRK